MSNQQGRVALVTGAARGIGLSIAERLAKEGACTVLVDVIAELDQAVSRLRSAGLNVHAARTDISREDEVKALVADVVARHGSLDILVNNAGISPKHDGRKALVEDTALDEWQAVLAVNLTGPFLLCRHAVPLMRKRGWGRIINMSSQAGRTRSQIAGSHYAASKAGLIGFSRTLAAEVGPAGITVNCIAPGRIETPMAAMAGADVNRAYVTQIPVARIGTPDDIAAAVAFLASDEAGFITGATIDVNGGHFMG
ncbi:SDR family NAD(P)-dependent oxidoreductase [Rhodoligotrophos ferricapiens]|uniref:SDR family NAD(P)-dependent oxidoreductase n=1 Tax=Rhodoligotrophos ferricapiens TaxID=3069264 RepID=UPI00315CB205